MFEVLNLEFFGIVDYTIYIFDPPAGIVNSDEKSILDYLANMLNVESVTIEDVIHTTYPDLMINDGDELQYNIIFHSDTEIVSQLEDGGEQVNWEDF